MAVEAPRNEEISGGGKNEAGEGVGSAFLQRRANGGSINIYEREQGGRKLREG